MGKKIILFVLFIFIVISFSGPVRAEIKKAFVIEEGTNRRVEVVDGEILVKFKSGVKNAAVQAVNKQLGCQTFKTLFPFGIHVIKIPRGKTVEEMLTSYRKNPSVKYAEPSHIRKAFATTPDDPIFPQQWGVKKIGCEDAWDLVTGSSDVVVAIVDSGVNYNHVDLSGNVWINTGEIPGNDIDDDGNGYQDDVRGWDFVADDNDPMDVYGHGTQVAGAACAAGNNGKVIAGVSWHSRIMIVRILDKNGEAGTPELVAGLAYAADNGANIINLSLGGDATNYFELDAIEYAIGKGCLLVAASGNANSDRVSYPAGYANVLAVGATNEDDERCTPDDWTGSYGSNYGYDLDVVAPGNIIYTTFYSATDDSAYGYASGTSLATPLVSGLAALVWSRYPNLRWDNVSQLIKASVDDVGQQGWDIQTGYGRINAKSAVQARYDPSSTWITAINYPNPFNPAQDPFTTISFATTSKPQSLSVYNIAGELILSVPSNELTLSEIRGEIGEPQFVYRYEWNGKTEREASVAQGIYVYCIKSIDGKVKSGKIALIR